MGSPLPGDAAALCGLNSGWSFNQHVVVPGNTVDSGLVGLRPGDLIRIIASGVVNNGSLLNAEHGPDGAIDDLAPSAPPWLLPGVNKYALIAHWNPEPGWFFAGSDMPCRELGGTVTDSVPARLLLSINDEDLFPRSNNTGGFDVEIRVWRPQRPPRLIFSWFRWPWKRQ